MSAVHDLAIFEIGKDNTYLRLAEEPVPSGSRGLTGFGYPEAAGKGLRVLRQIGNGITVDHRVASRIYMAVDMEKLGGASGGPVLSSKGKVVGVQVAGDDNISIAVTIQRLWDLADGKSGVICPASTSFNHCYELAIEDMRTVAGRHHPAAVYSLWKHYVDGDLEGGHADKLHLLKEAAERGHVLAQHNLAVRYAEGDVVEKDWRKADLWMERAAKQNFPPSLHQLGKRYEADGDSRAGPLLRRAAAAGYLRKEQYE